MKKIALVAISALLVIAMLAGCTQYIFVPLPGGDETGKPSGNTTASDTLTFMQALEKQLPGHVNSIINDKEPVSGLERVTDSSTGLSIMASRAGNDTATVEFKFTEAGYSVERYGTITSGSFTVEFKGKKTESTLTSETCSMDFTSLVVTKDGETSSDTITIKGLSAPSSAKLTVSADNTIDKVENFDSFSLTQAISTETTITMNGSSVSKDDIADSNTSGNFASGFGTKDYPYVIANEEQFANISKYSDQMKNGAYYYFSIESDLDYSTGDIDPYISDFRGELDFNNHKLEGLSFTRLTELNRDDGKQRTALINYCYGGAIRNLEYRPVGQCNLVLYIKADNVNNDRTSFVFENINVGDSSNHPRFSIGSNGGHFVSIAYGPNLDLTFRNCVNYCDIDLLYSTSNTGLFLNGYGIDRIDVKFENCDNYGTIQGGNFGFLIGNDKGIDTEDGYASITATGCENHGKIFMTNRCGFVGQDETKYQSVYTDGGNNDKGTMVKLPNLTANATVSDDKTITISGLDAVNYSEFNLMATCYADLMQGSTKRGTQQVAVETGREPISNINSLSFKKLGFIDKEYVSNEITKDDYGNEITSLDGTEYYVIDLEKFDKNSHTAEFNNGTHTSTSVTYILYAYDANGDLAGALTI